MLIVNISTFKSTSGGLSRSTLELLKFIKRHNINFKIIAPKKINEIKELEFVKDQILIKTPFSGFISILFDPIINFIISYQDKRAVILYDGFWPVFSFCETICTVHDLYFLKEKWNWRFIKTSVWSYYWKFSFKQILRSKTTIRAISQTTKTEIEKYVFSISMNKPKIITFYHPNIKLNFRRKEANNDINSQQYLIHIGNIIERKNVQFLIERCQELKEKLKLIGNNHLKINFSKFNNVDYLGFVTEQTKQNLLNSAQIFVIASSCEGFSFPIFESLEEGVPVLAPNISIFKEFLPQEFLYEYLDPDSFQEKLLIIKGNTSAVHSIQLNFAKNALLIDDKNILIGLLNYLE